MWSLLVVLVLLAVTRDWAWLRPFASDRASQWRLAVASVLITANWLLYIYAVNSDQVVETSLGYFINPLVTVLIGVLLLGERLNRVQWVAVGLGAAAVLVIAVDYGRPPWIALGLAFSFAIYGLIKKQVGPRVGAVASLSVESAVMFVPALAVPRHPRRRAGTPTSATTGWGMRPCWQAREWRPPYPCSSSRRRPDGCR